MGSRALCPGKGFVSLRWHLPAAAPEMMEPGVVQMLQGSVGN